MNYYQILNLPNNATQREIYDSFADKINYNKSFDEQISIIDAFITLADINMRKKYDLSIGLNFSDNVPQYLYSYFDNGNGYFDINGYFAGSKSLTQFLENRKGSDIRSSDNVEKYYSEAEIYQEFANLDLKDKSLEAFRYDLSNLDELDKFEIFKTIYEKYKSEFIFSNDFITTIGHTNFNSMPIDDASKLYCQKVLNYKRGVCTHFAALLYEELKALGIEAYYVRMILRKWFHHVVLYRVGNEWYIGDLANEFLKGNAGYKIVGNNYSCIKLTELLLENKQLLNLAYLPNFFGESFLSSEVVTLGKFLELKKINEDKKL